VQPLPRGQDASPVSAATGPAYDLIVAAARTVAPPATPFAPGLVLGATDSRHYAGVAESVYRFAPVVLTDADLAGIHGTNERVSVANMDRMCTFFAELVATGAS